MREKILTYIERNSRVDLKDLAIMLGTDEAAVANEIADMEKEGVICGYHTLIDWDKTSSEKVTALIEVKVTPQRGLGFDKIAERIYNYPEVDCVYLISGGFDFMVMIEGKTMRGVAQFVSEKLSTQESVQMCIRDRMGAVYRMPFFYVEDLKVFLPELEQRGDVYKRQDKLLEFMING